MSKKGDREVEWREAVKPRWYIPRTVRVDCREVRDKDGKRK